MLRQDVSSYLRRLLDDTPNHSLSGAGISVLLKSYFPTFNAQEFDCRNLRDFIRKNVPEICEIGRAGTDVIYGLKNRQQNLFVTPVQKAIPESIIQTSPVPPIPKDDASRADFERPISKIQQTALAQLLTNPRIWKTFSSPGNPFQLYLNPASGLVRVLSPQGQPDSSWVKISPISADALLQIAKDFIATLPEPQRELLQNTLLQPKWWLPYFDVLRTLGLSFKWRFFKRRRVSQEFERSISNIPAPSLVADVMSTSQRPEPAERLAEARSPESVVRHVAIQVVGRMTETELRTLNLPLGYMVDVMAAR